MPCGGCTACCVNDVVVLGPQDAPDAFQWHFESFRGQRVAALDRKANGECVYLTPTGCGIHGRAPVICTRMDCRVLLLLTPDDVQRRRVAENPQMERVYVAGRERLATLRGASAR